jgi:uncharacterized protein YbjT (DUF2867 family)
MRILVTGGSGFVGKAIVEKLMTIEYITVRASVRHSKDSMDLKNPDTVIAHLSRETSWLEALVDINVVVHAAAVTAAVADAAVAAVVVTAFMRNNNK